ncbi:hypothetical protein B1812_14505 [Methylocystis bryophila]|uniref:Uncharacterized protein n=1 Tax=Methylocystis bryophila TaxID=655015 RepID=A0A1W6MWX6_9HYPH|nr:hypothetical protein B1812_14505 [Methylocystis bryophila]
MRFWTDWLQTNLFDSIMIYFASYFRRENPTITPARRASSLRSIIIVGSTASLTIFLAKANCGL